MSTFYHIIAKRHLDSHWSTWFDFVSVTNRENGEAVLARPIRDQTALHAVLVIIRDLGLPLIAVRPVAMHAPGDRVEDGGAAQCYSQLVCLSRPSVA